MLKDQINVNTYLNVLIAITLVFFSYIGTQYDKRFDKIDIRFEKIDARFEKIDKKLDIIIGSINDNKINIARIEEKQNYLSSRVQKLDIAYDVKSDQ